MSGDVHLVVVDDEPDIRETLQEYLESQGYRVTAADGGAALRAVFADQQVDLVILDITMPGEDGLSLARFLRENSDVGIVMLTGAGDIVDRVVGLEVGADDYIAKPVDLRELLARVKAVLRRMEPAGEVEAAPEATEPAVAPDELVPFGDCRLDLAAHRLLDPSGVEIAITAMEFDLLKAFAERPNRVLTRDQLLELAHNRGWDPFDRSIDIRIARLRRKLEADPANPQVIRTVRGTGYLYAPGGD
jgi:two-component system phosphate regulon response regulator OmpR